MLPDMSWLMVILLVGAVARVTTLIRTDRITRTPRHKLLHKLPPQSYIAYLLGCPWCISFWVALAAAITAYFWWHDTWYRILVLALALSYAASMLAHGPWEDESDLPLDRPLDEVTGR